MIGTSLDVSATRSLGCSEMQGYLFSAPKPPAEIRDLLFSYQPEPVAKPARRERKRKPVAHSA